MVSLPEQAKLGCVHRDKTNAGGVLDHNGGRRTAEGTVVLPSGHQATLLTVAGQCWTSIADQMRENIQLAGGGAIPLAVAFAVSSLRIYVLPLWTTHWYVPVVSPVAAQGHNWAKTTMATVAILAHVTCGIVMMLCAAAQFDVRLRRRNPAAHRWSGRLYVAVGLITVASLQPLRETVGQGRGQVPSRSMQLGIDAATTMWLASTGGAVYHAVVTKHYDKHRRLMVFSFATAMAPVLQRMLIWVPLTPLAIFARLAIDAVHGVPFWLSAWPDASGKNAWAPPASHTAFIGFGAGSTRVFSLEGYAIAEKLTFGASSWGGLLAAAIFAYHLQNTQSFSDTEGLSVLRVIASSLEAGTLDFSDFLRLFGIKADDDSILSSYLRGPSWFLDKVGRNEPPSHRGSSSEAPNSKCQTKSEAVKESLPDKGGVHDEEGDFEPKRSQLEAGILPAAPLLARMLQVALWALLPALAGSFALAMSAVFITSIVFALYTILLGEVMFAAAATVPIYLAAMSLRTLLLLVPDLA